jgi:hypothetical protein
MRAIYFLAAITLLVRAQICLATEGMLNYVASDSGYAFGTGGWTFQTLTPISVTSLGVFDYILNPNAQNQSPMSVGLWDNSGTLLASNSVTATSLLVNQSRYEPITPVTLTPGLTYHLGAYYPTLAVTTLLAEVPGNGGSASMAPEIQLGMAVAEASGFASPNTQVGGSGSALLVPNFQFTDVPEPASASLLLLCGLVMGWRKRVNSKW